MHLLTLLLPCVFPWRRLSSRWLLESCKSKLIPSVEKLQREKDEYLQQAIGALRNEMALLVPHVCEQIREELGRLVSRKVGKGVGKRTEGRACAEDPSERLTVMLHLTTLYPVPTAPAVPTQASSSLTSSGRPASVKNPMAQFPVILHLITSPYFRPAAVTPQLITDLGAFLTLTAAGGPGSGAQAALAEFKATLMHVLEALCQQTELVLQHYEVCWGWIYAVLLASSHADKRSG